MGEGWIIFLVSQCSSQPDAVPICWLVALLCMGKLGSLWGWPWLGQLCPVLLSPPLPLPVLGALPRLLNREGQQPGLSQGPWPLMVADSELGFAPFGLQCSAGLVWVSWGGH